jgi:hypothetical protein
MSKTMLITVATAALIAMSSLAGCRAEECQKMLRCCDEVRGEEGVGAACGEMAEQVKDPTTCRSVVRAVNAMFEERDEQAPAACQ